MKLINLFESTEEDDKILEWFRDHITTSDSGHKLYEPDFLTVKDKLAYYKGIMLNLTCEELKYQIGRIQMITIEDLKTVRNFPDKPGAADDIYAGGNLIEKIDHPIVCKRLILARNKITSLKNIHKFVKCESIVIWNNPIKDSILGLLLIPGIIVIDDGRNGDLTKEYKKPNDAIAIVSKYVGKGKTGILDAQQELIDNDLDDFAEV